MRISVRVRPGASHPAVGGSFDGALVIRVSERAVDGRATAAALEALAKAVGLPRRSLTLVSGATSRTKVVELPDSAQAAVTELLEH